MINVETMATIEERAEQWSMNYCTKGRRDIAHIAYEMGAIEQRRIDIDKACLEFCNCFGCGSFEICNKDKNWCVARLNFSKAMMDSYGNNRG